jgi:hypothetical protein
VHLQQCSLYMHFVMITCQLQMLLPSTQNALGYMGITHTTELCSDGTFCRQL